MIMQPPAYKPTKGFPRRTFKGVAGTTIALGIAIIVIGIAEIIYSVKIGRECSHIYKDMVYMDDMVYPDDEEPRWRKKRWIESSSEENDPHLRWLADSVDHMGVEDRCATFSCVGALSAVVYAACGVIFIVTGSLGVGAARTMVGHRQSGLKTGYIVMNILNVLGFAPTVFFIGFAIAKSAPIVVGKDDYYTGHVVTGYLVGFSGLALTILSLLGASISCCCAPTEEHVKVITMAASPVQQMAPAMIVPAPLQVDEKAQLVANEATEA